MAGSATALRGPGASVTTAEAPSRWAPARDRSRGETWASASRSCPWAMDRRARSCPWAMDRRAGPCRRAMDRGAGPCRRAMDRARSCLWAMDRKGGTARARASGSARSARARARGCPSGHTWGARWSRWASDRSVRPPGPPWKGRWRPSPRAPRGRRHDARRRSLDVAPRSRDADVARAPIRHLFGHAPRPYRVCPGILGAPYDSARNEPGSRVERPTNRARTAPTTLGWRRDVQPS